MNRRRPRLRKVSKSGYPQIPNPAGSRERCYTCFRPKQVCFCHVIPKIENRTNVLMLQHQRERFHPFNTARIVYRALAHVDLIAGRTNELARRELPILPKAGLLFPSRGSQLLDELPPHKIPEQLVVIDGTWHQAKSMYRDIPQLGALPCYRLAPQQPGNYRIRLEPDAHSLSTLEATVAALKVLEPQTKDLDKLLACFEHMVEKQLAHPAAKYDRDPNHKQKTLNVPSVIKHDLSRIIVAYGEPTPIDFEAVSREVETGGLSRKSRLRQKDLAREPACFLFQRATSNAIHHCPLQTLEPLPCAFLNLMELDAADFRSAISHSQFKEIWRNHVGPDDVVIANNQNTLRLLGRVGIHPNRSFTLRSINYDPDNEFRSVVDFLYHQNVSLDTDFAFGRGGKRLAAAVALVRFLHGHSAAQITDLD